MAEELYEGVEWIVCNSRDVSRLGEERRGCLIWVLLGDVVVVEAVLLVD